MNKIKKSLKFLIAAGFLIFPFIAFAQSAAEQQNCASFAKQFEGIYSKVPSYYCSANAVLIKFINTALIFSGTVAILSIVLGGFWYLTSAGNEEQSEKGRKVIINSILALIIIILAWTIVTIISNVFTTAK